MKKLAIVFMIFALALVSNMASANELIDVWAKIRVLDFDKAYIEGSQEVTNIYGEVVLLDSIGTGEMNDYMTVMTEYGEASPEYVKAVSYILRNYKQLSMSPFCENDKQEKLHQAFLGGKAPKTMEVKLSIWTNEDGKILVSIVDYKL